MPNRRRGKDRSLSPQQGAGQGRRPSPSSLEYIETTITAYRGPLPPVEMLRDLDALIPGSAARSFALFEDQARHRMDLERRTIMGDNLQSRLGLGAGFVIALVAIVGAIYLIATDHGSAGLTTIIGTLVALVGAFAYGTKSRKDERLQKTSRQQPLRQR